MVDVDEEVGIAKLRSSMVVASFLSMASSSLWFVLALVRGRMMSLLDDLRSFLRMILSHLWDAPILCIVWNGAHMACLIFMCI